VYNIDSSYQLGTMLQRAFVNALFIASCRKRVCFTGHRNIDWRLMLVVVRSKHLNCSVSSCWTKTIMQVMKFVENWKSWLMLVKTLKSQFFFLLSSSNLLNTITLVSEAFFLLITHPLSPKCRGSVERR